MSTESAELNQTQATQETPEVDTKPVEPVMSNDLIDVAEDFDPEANVEAELGLVDAPFSSKVEGKMNAVEPATYSIMGSFTALTKFTAIFDKRDWFGTIRGVGEFFGPGNFSKPTCKAQILARLNENLPYFMTNYVGLWSVFMIFTVLTSLKLFLTVCLVTYGWIWANKQEGIGFGAVKATGSAKTVITTGLAGVVIAYTSGFDQIMWLFTLNGFIACVHAACHAGKDSEYALAEGIESNFETEIQA